ncbi:hypothetical protein HY003_01385 [Candidatus Saccharibacteria bacterium]|nr:hypothetical protein [Candidatus Saccharibacteria bacterium]MBI3337931.1 hypothetical protein [Candidatus Saccharibacteria bacterium]
MIQGLLIRFAASCDGGGFFGLPKWYKYLDGVPQSSGCVPKISGISDVWLIVAAIIEILLRIAALVAIGFVVWGGIQFISSQGEPDKTSKARNIIINALVGLVITIGASTVVSFVAGSIN